MGNTKQLIIVPPMSETFQKLHEVLNEIADAEKIEISKINEAKALNEMMISGQCLVIFSNAKSCALFLQENKSHIAKFHSKVILLVPKEIPAKSLIKFLKVGLTEAIHEGSPPKTLLHKIKMQLRTIKARSFDFGLENEDQVVKNNLFTGKKSMSTMIDHARHNRTSSLDETLEMYNLLNGQPSGGEIYGNLRSDGISTNKMSSRTNYTEYDDDNGVSSFKSHKEKNIYYPTRKKIDNGLKKISEDIKKIQALREREAKKSSGLKSLNEKLLSLKKEKNRKDQNAKDCINESESTDETIDYGLGKNKRKNKFDQKESNEESGRTDQKDEGIIGLKEKTNKNFDENEIDFNNAQVDSLNSGSLEAEQNTPKAEEDAGYRIEKKSFHKRDISDELAEADNHDKQDNEDEIERNKFHKKIHNIMTDSEAELLGDGPIVIEESEKRHKTKGLNGGEENLKEKKSSDESFTDFRPEKKVYKIVEDNDVDSEKSIAEGDEGFYKKKRQEDIYIDMSGLNEEKNSNENISGFDFDDAGVSEENWTDLSDNKNASKNKNEDHVNIEESLSQHDSNEKTEEKKSNNKSKRGQESDFDSALDDDDRKKNPYSWGNLVDKNKSSNLDLQKSHRLQVDLSFSYLTKNVEEHTIDYHKIKKEFDKKTPIDEIAEVKNLPGERNEEEFIAEERNPKKVIGVDFRGIEFCIDIVKLIYNKDTEDLDYFKSIANELITQYNGFAVFYTHETSTNKFLETFNAFNDAHRQSWEFIKLYDDFDDFFKKTMPVWQCREIQDKSHNEKFWESFELPLWAEKELADKKVMLIFPYFDGVDLMGIAIVFFPEGLVTLKEKSILMTLGTAQTVFFNTNQRKSEIDTDSTKDSSILEKIKSVFIVVFRFFKGGSK